MCKKKPALPQAASVSARIALPANVNAIAATDSAVWIVSDDNRLFRIDPATNKIVATVTLPDGEWPEANVAVGDGAVWVTVASPSTIAEPQLDNLLRLDPQSNQIVARIPVGSSPEGIAITPDSIWTANHRAEWDRATSTTTGTYDVSQVNTASNAETARPVVEQRNRGSGSNDDWCCGPQGMTFAAGSVWTGDPQASGHGIVLRIDPATHAVVAQISMSQSNAQACGRLVGDETAIWMTSGCDLPYVAHIDPQTNRVAATINTGSAAQDVALGLGSVWVTSIIALNRINPATNKIVGRTTVASATAVATGAGSVWAGSGRSVLRLKPR